MKILLKKKEVQIKKMVTEKNEIEKGLVKIDGENLLEKHSSKKIHVKLDKEVSDKYKKILIQIEDLINSFIDIDIKGNWQNCINGFGEIISKNENITDVQKKDFLSEIIKNIIVDYEYALKLHNLEINFKLPVIIEELTKRKSGINSALSNLKSSISLSNQGDQTFIVGNYSTVTDFAKFLG